MFLHRDMSDCTCEQHKQERALREQSAELIEDLDGYLVEIDSIVKARHFSPSAKLAAIEKVLFGYFEVPAATPETPREGTTKESST